MVTINKEIKNEIDIDVVKSIVDIASRFKSDIVFYNFDQKANAKSLINLLAIGFLNTNNLLFEISGDDEKIAYEALNNYLENKIY